MEIPNYMCISGGIKNEQMHLNWESVIFAKVVFLDKTQSCSTPILYQLKDTTLTNLLSDPPQFPISHLINDSFIHLGSVENIDKKNKRITLSNKNSVSYNHLVTVSGSKPITTHHDPQLLVGLQTLIDALKVKSKISCANTNTSLNTNCLKAPCPSSSTKHNPNMDKINLPNILASEHHSSTDIYTHNERLYEVQL